MAGNASCVPAESPSKALNLASSTCSEIFAQVHVDDIIYSMNDLSDSIHIVRGSMRAQIILTQLMNLAPPLSEKFNPARCEHR